MESDEDGKKMCNALNALKEVFKEALKEVDSKGRTYRKNIGK